MLLRPVSDLVFGSGDSASPLFETQFDCGSAWGDLYVLLFLLSTYKLKDNGHLIVDTSSDGERADNDKIRQRFDHVGHSSSRAAPISGRQSEF